MNDVMNVIAMVFDGPVVPALSEAAERHLWPVVRPATPRDAIAEVLRRQPLAVVAQLAPPPDEQSLGLNVVRLIRRRHGVPLVAVAAWHSVELETAARLAGATSYLPDRASAEEMATTVRAMLRHARDAPASCRLESAASGAASTVDLSGDANHVTPKHRSSRRRPSALRNR